MNTRQRKKIGQKEKEDRKKATLAARDLVEEYVKELGKRERCPICGEEMPETFQKHLFSYYLPKYEGNQFKKKLSRLRKIRKGYIDLLKNKEFLQYITGSATDSPKKIKRSKEIFEKEFIERCFGDWTDKEKRPISKEEKKALFKNIPYCYLCYGRIKTIEESEADHIEPYSKGHDTKFNNILLAHRDCNRKKKANDLQACRENKTLKKKIKRNRKNIQRYLTCLKDWNKAHLLDRYTALRKYAKSDLGLK